MTAANLVEHLRHRVEREVKQARAEVEVARADRDAWMQRAMQAEHRMRRWRMTWQRAVLVAASFFALGTVCGILIADRVALRVPCSQEVAP